MGQVFNRHALRISVATAALLAFAAPVAAVAQAQAYNFNLPAQDLISTLKAVASITRHQVTFQDASVRGKRAPALKGQYTVQEALQRLVANHDLSIGTGKSGIFIIREAEAPRQKNLKLAGLSVTSAGSGMAQGGASQPTIRPDPETLRTNADGTPVEDDELITVTGSRIKRPGYDTLEPIVVVSGDYLETYNYTSLADALNQTPGFVVGAGNNVTTDFVQQPFSVGQSYVNKFNLGTQRTLTVVNGRRHVSTNAPALSGAPPGAQVDQGMFGTSMVDRIEVIAIGGAPAYGTDAIGGTVNIILKSNFEGLSIKAQSGINEYGDGASYQLAANGGINTANGRGNISAALNFVKTEGLLAISRPQFQGERYLNQTTNTTCGEGPALLPGRPANDGRFFTNVPCNGAGTAGLTDGIPGTIVIRQLRNVGVTTGGLLYPVTLPNPTGTVGFGLNSFQQPIGFGPNQNIRLQFAPDGTLVPYDPGIPFPSGIASGGDGWNPALAFPLGADLERYSAYVTGNYKLTDHIRVFAEGTLYRSYAQELVNQPLFQSGAGGITGSMVFSVTDPRLTSQARTTLQSLGLTSFRLMRVSRDLYTSKSNSRSDVFRGVFGLDGDFSLGGYKFFWEASVNRGQTEGYFYSDQVNKQNLVNALNVSQATPTSPIVCNVTNVTTANSVLPGFAPIADPACVPLNVFGDGAPSAAAIAYVTDRVRSRSTLKQTVYNASITGNVFDLWGAGPIGVAVGYEHRYEFGSFRPDEFLRQGRGLLNPIVPVSGSFNTDEVFGELLVPLVSPSNNVPFINAAQLEAKARYVDNTVNGGYWAYTLGGLLAPIQGVTFRGNYTRSLRAPSIVELYLPLTVGSATVFQDPCTTGRITQGPDPALRQKNCQAFFDAYKINGSTFNPLGLTQTKQGGNPNLLNEEARAYTFGVVLKPSFIPKLNIAVDWSRIRITGPISLFQNTAIGSGCYDNPNFDTSDVDNANQYCSLIDRYKLGQLLPDGVTPAAPGTLPNIAARPGITNVYQNGAFMHFEGLTASADYSVPLAVLGLNKWNLSLGAQYYYVHKQQVAIIPLAVTESDGAGGNPKHTGSINVGLSDGIFHVNLTGIYYGKAVANLNYTPDGNDFNDIPAHSMFHGAFGWNFSQKASLNFAIQNLFDKTAPAPYSGGGGGIFDYVGRRYSVSVNYKFF